MNELREAVRVWLEEKVLTMIRQYEARWDATWAYYRALPKTPPKEAMIGMPITELVDLFCGSPHDPRCRVEDAPSRFAEQKSKVRKVMLMAALKRLEKGFRIQRIEGLHPEKPKCRPCRFGPVIRYKALGLMDSIALAAADDNQMTLG